MVKTIWTSDLQCGRAPYAGKTKAERSGPLGWTLYERKTLFAVNPHLEYDQMRHQHPLFGVQTVPQRLRTLWQHEQAYRDQIARDSNHPPDSQGRMS